MIYFIFTLIRFAWEFIKRNWVYLLLIFFITQYLVGFEEADGNSMSPNIKDTNLMVVVKEKGYIRTHLDRYDIVILKNKKTNNNHYCKRIVGLPGETISCKDGYIYINNEKLMTDIYSNELINDCGILSKPITLSNNEYFVMGDNRNNSYDCRHIGPILKTDIKGKVINWF